LENLECAKAIQWWPYKSRKNQFWATYWWNRSPLNDSTKWVELRGGIKEMKSGWKSEVRGSNLGSPSSLWPWIAKKIQQKYSQPYSVPLMIDFARCSLKDFKKSLFGLFSTQLNYIVTWNLSLVMRKWKVSCIIAWNDFERKFK